VARSIKFMDLINNSSNQYHTEAEIDANPELQRTEGNPTVAKEMMWHTKVYKSLATLGDFLCYVWYYDHDYDPLRVTTGSKRIHIVPSEERIEGDAELNKYFDLYSNLYPEGAIYVNPIIRRNGTKFQSNKDLKDCVKYMSGVAGHYGADPSKIVATDIQDGEKMYDMTYDLTASSVFSDVSNDTLENLTSGPVGGGSLSKNYETVFSSGSISMSDINNNFGAGHALGSYYRGQGIANISQNSHVPTSGSISFNNLRGCCGKITANANGNWAHAQARWELFSQTEWDSGITKVINMNGNVGSNDTGNPAVRLNNSGGGNITLNINNGSGGGGGSGGPACRGHAGSRGSAAAGNGGSGGLALHVASPVKIPSGHFNSRIAAGGGGGGGGGAGGQGGGGGNSGGYKCSGWFCHSQYRWCRGDGGTGGAGGGGGQGGRGNGYYWDGSNNWWVDSHHAGQGGGLAGSAGSNGNSRAGGRGGDGGAGGNGGNHGNNGSTGNTGQTGSNGGGAGANCGGYPGGQSGKAGSGGGSGGSAGTKYTTSHAGSISLI